MNSLDWLTTLLLWWLICFVFLRVQKRITGRNFRKDLVLAFVQSIILLLGLYLFFYFYK